MSLPVEDIVAQVDALTDQQRAGLAAQLLLKIEDPACRLALRRTAEIATQIADALDRDAFMKEQSCRTHPTPSPSPAPSRLSTR